MTNWTDRHPSVAHFEDLFDFEHLPAKLQAVSRPISQLAEDMLGEVKDGPELSAGLRKLVEAKDCFVRQMVKDGKPETLAGAESEAEKLAEGQVKEYAPQYVMDFLGLVAEHRPVTLADIEQWTAAERAEVVKWAAAVHSSASDNDDVVVPPKPAVLA